MEQQGRKSVITLVFIALFISMVLILVFQLTGSVERDPLYTDLTASTFYAKNGFLPSYANITSPGDLEWDLTLPPHSGNLIMSDLPSPGNSAKYGRFSTAVRDIEEFTIYIPFTLVKDKYDELWGEQYSYPALYFIGIGENWEIYLNSHSIAKEIYLDKNGNITKFRSVYRISVPIDKSILREGGNDLVIHVLGARSSKWAGLRYVSPYYLGDTSYITNSFKSNIDLVLCAVFMFAGLYHLLIYALRKTDRYNLLYAVCTTVASAYYFFKMPAAHSIVSNTEYLERLDYSLLYLFVIMFCAFVDSINYGRVTTPTVTYGVAGSLLAIMQWFFPIWFAYDLLRVWQFITIAFLVYFLVFCILWRLLTGAAGISKDAGSKHGLWRSLLIYLTTTEFGNVSILLFFIVPTAFIDIVNLAVFKVNLSLSQYSYLGIVLCMAYILTRKFPSQAEVTALYSALEQNIQNTRLTPEEKKVAHLFIGGETQRNIVRKLRMTTDEIERHEKSIRQKLNLTGGPNPEIAAVATEYKLTQRETEMLTYLCDGFSTVDIAAELCITEDTVRSHMRNLLNKLHIEKRSDVAVWINKRKQAAEQHFSKSADL